MCSDRDYYTTAVQVQSSDSAQMMSTSDSGVVMCQPADDAISTITAMTMDDSASFLLGADSDNDTAIFDVEHHGKNMVVAKNGRGAQRKKYALQYISCSVCSFTPVHC